MNTLDVMDNMYVHFARFLQTIYTIKNLKSKRKYKISNIWYCSLNQCHVYSGKIRRYFVSPPFLFSQWFSKIMQSRSLLNKIAPQICLSTTMPHQRIEIGEAFWHFFQLQNQRTGVQGCHINGTKHSNMVARWTILENKPRRSQSNVLSL